MNYPLRLALSCQIPFSVAVMPYDATSCFFCPAEAPPSTATWGLLSTFGSKGREAALAPFGVSPLFFFFFLVLSRLSFRREGNAKLNIYYFPHGHPSSLLPTSSHKALNLFFKGKKPMGLLTTLVLWLWCTFSWVCGVTRLLQAWVGERKRVNTGRKDLLP